MPYINLVKVVVMSKKYFFCLLALFYLNQVKAQLIFNNERETAIYLSIAYYLDTKDFKGWYSAGWYYIEPFEKRVIIEDNLNDSCYFYYAYDSEGNIFEDKNGHAFVVEKQKVFKIKNADMQSQINSDSRVFYFFRKIDPFPNASYTITISAKN